MFISSNTSPGKEKTFVWYKNIINERLLTDFKEKAQLFVDGVGLTKHQQSKTNDNTSMNYFPQK